MDFLSALILSGCAASWADPQETFAESSADASSDEIITLESVAAEETEPPVIDETFTDENFSAEKRGTVILRCLEDGSAPDKGALRIFNRHNAWNGIGYNADKFRGNEL
ncbi:hypothetical protein [Huintestinicola butyrica]|uniref:hypothetical protein n=1 Tax=Huintestinicola butyrica TaxID=2981728 RepID=UPI003F7F3AC2